MIMKQKPKDNKAAQSVSGPSANNCPPTPRPVFYVALAHTFVLRKKKCLCGILVKFMHISHSLKQLFKK